MLSYIEYECTLEVHFTQNLIANKWTLINYGLPILLQVSFFMANIMKNEHGGENNCANYRKYYNINDYEMYTVI